MNPAKQISREEATALLAAEPLRHFTMSAMLKDAQAPDCYQAGKSLLVKTPSKDGAFAFFAYGDDAEETTSIEPLLSHLEGSEQLFYVQDDRVAAVIRERFSIGLASDCIQLYLPEDVPLGEGGDGIVELLPDQAAYIHAHYSYRDVIPVDYLRERIEKAPAIGIMANGVLAGFVMTHEEMTMGVLHVLPEYRRIGLGKRLNAELSRRLRALNLPCIVEIVSDNHASLSLAKAAGFLPLQKVHWLHRQG